MLVSFLKSYKIVLMLNQTAVSVNYCNLGVNEVEMSWFEADAKVLGLALVQEIYGVPMVYLHDMELCF